MMRINSGIVLQNFNPIVTQNYKKFLDLGNPYNCISILSDFDFDEILIINKIRKLDEKYLSFLEKLASMSKLPLAFTGNLTEIEYCYRLIESGFERIFFNSLHFNNLDKIIEVSKRLGKQSVGLKLDIVIKDAKHLIKSKADYYDLDKYLINQTDMCSKIYSEINFNFVQWDGKNNETQTIFKIIEKYLNTNVNLSITGGVVTHKMLENFAKKKVDACYCFIAPSTDINKKVKLPNDSLVRHRRKVN